MAPLAVAMLLLRTSAQLKQQQEKNQQLELAVSGHDATVADLLARLSQQEKENEKVTLVNSGYDATVADLRARIKQQEDENKDLTLAKSSQDASILDLRTKLQYKEKKIKELTLAQSDSKVSILWLGTQIHEQDTKNKKLAFGMRKKSRENDILKEENFQLQSTINDHRHSEEKFLDMREVYNTQQDELEYLRGKTKGLCLQIDDFYDEKSDLSDEVDNLRHQNKRLRVDIDRLNHKVDDLHYQNNGLRNENDDQSYEISDLRIWKNDLHDENNRLSYKINAIRTECEQHDCLKCTPRNASSMCQKK